MKTKSILSPHSEKEIIQAVHQAQESNRSIHCFSAGFNWGYGTNSAIDNQAIHLDLSQMNQIISFDKDLGILKIEPGVTQGDLQAYLEKNNYDYHVPNNGAGHRASIMGNALERGFGIAPLQDHASSILSIRGILSDGSIYESALKEIDPKLADCFSWGVGPQLDKMVSQSSWIIVTEMSIQLKKRQECTDIILLTFSEAQLGQIILMLQNLMSEMEGSIGSIKIFNRKQVIKNNDSLINRIFFSYDEWFLTIVIYSHSLTRNSIIKLTKKRIRQFLKAKVSILNSGKIHFLTKLFSLIPGNESSEHFFKIKDLNEMMNLARGRTSEVGFKALDVDFDYLKNDQFDFAKFDKKLVWFSPICPLIPARALQLIDLVRTLNVDSEFKFKTYTWTILNQRTLALVMPIVYDFDKNENFWEWYKKIHIEMKEKGFIPYRFHNEMMPTLREDLLPHYYGHVKKFENAMNPNSLILKGRY
ncbi:MAG: FAD-dependent oxidoreductase [Bacteriovoracaceae bacterium]|nr:FAD-dependent oxidoreductase [Bacteriovoracaceae bacterium]